MSSARSNVDDLFLKLLERLQAEGVKYVLVGGQAVRINGFLRATEDVDLLLEATEENGARVIKALNFLASSSELDPQWFAPHPGGEIENIRVADDLIIDLLFAANGHSITDLANQTITTTINDVPVSVLNIDGLLKTKTDYREKDILDKIVLRKLQDAARK